MERVFGDIIDNYTDNPKESGKVGKGPWVAVTTTIAGELVANAATSGYKHNVHSSYSTAQQLTLQRAQHLDGVKHDSNPVTSSTML